MYLQIKLEDSLIKWLESEATRLGLKPSQVARMILVKAHTEALGK